MKKEWHWKYYPYMYWRSLKNYKQYLYVRIYIYIYIWLWKKYCPVLFCWDSDNKIMLEVKEKKSNWLLYCIWLCKRLCKIMCMLIWSVLNYMKIGKCIIILEELNKKQVCIFLHFLEVAAIDKAARCRLSLSTWRNHSPLRNCLPLPIHFYTVHGLPPIASIFLLKLKSLISYDINVIVVSSINLKVFYCLFLPERFCFLVDIFFINHIICCWYYF